MHIKTIITYLIACVQNILTRYLFNLLIHQGSLNLARTKVWKDFLQNCKNEILIIYFFGLQGFNFLKCFELH